MPTHLTPGLLAALQEIVVRIEFKYSPNLTIIDTPGLISAAPGKKNTALQQAAKAVETMVTQKMMQQVRQGPEMIIPRCCLQLAMQQMYL
jgi:hypothetical protein